MNAAGAGTAQLLLITDCTVGDEHIAQILKLAGRGITRDHIDIIGAGRTCTWPLELDAHGHNSIEDVASHLWLLAGYLSQNRDTVHAIRNLGCNLQLNVYGVTLDPPVSMAASTLQQLGELDIQLALFPSRVCRQHGVYAEGQLSSVENLSVGKHHSLRSSWFLCQPAIAFAVWRRVIDG